MKRNGRGKGRRRGLGGGKPRDESGGYTLALPARDTVGHSPIPIPAGLPSSLRHCSTLQLTWRDSRFQSLPGSPHPSDRYPHNITLQAAPCKRFQKHSLEHFVPGRQGGQKSSLILLLPPPKKLRASPLSSSLSEMLGKQERQHRFKIHS